MNINRINEAIADKFFKVHLIAKSGTGVVIDWSRTGDSCVQTINQNELVGQNEETIVKWFEDLSENPKLQETSGFKSGGGRVKR